MKKLMITAAAICAAAFANAAAFDWSADYMMNAGGGFYEGVAGRVFTTADISIEALSAELAKGDFTSWTSLGQLEKATDAMGSVAISTYEGSKTAGTYDFYAVFLDAEDTASAKNFFVTDIKDNVALVDGQGNETPVEFGFQYERSMVGSNWTAINSVPEPTSGLLLLLGVAGLALRRRRA